MNEGELTDNTTTTLWMLQREDMNQLRLHFRTEMNACIDKVLELEKQLSDTQTRLDSLARIVIGDSKDDSWKHSHEHRLGVLDGHDGKDFTRSPLHRLKREAEMARHLDEFPKIIMPGAILLQGTEPDKSSPQYQSDIHTEEQKVST